MQKVMMSFEKKVLVLLGQQAKLGQKIFFLKLGQTNFLRKNVRDWVDSNFII